jgi:AcrR family transcriptional regulator
MARAAASGPPSPSRVTSIDRRTSLLDAAAAIIEKDGVEAVSMESIADRAGVSRPLVYKHFTNRRDALAALYEREAARLHARMTARVRAVDTLAGMYRELLRTALEAAREQPRVFAALHSVSGLTRDEERLRQRRRDRTVGFFTAQAVKEYGVSEPVSRAANRLLLVNLSAAVTQWFQHPTLQQAALIEHAYLGLVHGGLGLLATRTVGDLAGDRARR